MSWPFVYYPDERLSATELASARLDGLVVELGEAFIPADAVETDQLRAATLRPLVRDDLTVTHETAAWVHGAVAVAPRPLRVQRAVDSRVAHVLDARLRYRDGAMPARDVVTIGGIHVTSPARTLIDVVCQFVAGDVRARATIDALRHWQPRLVEAALLRLDETGPLRHKRSARAWLLRIDAQPDVTR